MVFILQCVNVVYHTDGFVYNEEALHSLKVSAQQREKQNKTKQKNNQNKTKNNSQNGRKYLQMNIPTRD